MASEMFRVKSFSALAGAIPTFAKLDLPSPKPEASFSHHAEVAHKQEFFEKERRKQRTKNIFRIIGLVLLASAVASFLIVLITSDKVQDETIEILHFLEHLPRWLSVLLMIGLYCLALLFFCPGTPFNLASGFLYGMWIGAGTALAGCIAGALVAFLLGRTIAREWVKSLVDKNRKFKAVDWAIHKNGLYLVFLTRLSPLFPFPLLNYAFGITRVRTITYLLGTSMGVLPGTLAYTYLGTLMRNLADMWTTESNENPTQWSPKKIIWASIGAFVTLISIIIISFITKRAISNATKQYEELHGNPEAFEYELQEKAKEPNDLDSSNHPLVKVADPAEDNPVQ